MTQFHLTRRAMMLGGLGLAATTLAACTTTGAPRPEAPAAPAFPAPGPEYLSMYGPLPAERFPVPRARIETIDPTYWRQEVDNPTGEPAGVVVVDTPNRFLYWTLPGGKAMRYGAGIGRDGFAWGGRARIAYKREWPRWTPPAAMIARQPELEPYRNGMEPGLENPLGARALYIHDSSGDTLYRVHGTSEEWSIGKAVSSGCVRLLAHDVIDLHARVPDGTPILVRQ
ncbi:L,D-transpeptidase [Arsenicitalea aurantiaca]|uniref:L,D-transpeptidase n=1 Tax=Arsenicitalea aurantiaca TaxID=1783274 RepID=A0A433X878_9HYPH|nr:L,D-transpeptidase [Arsenicitalea aurantiaca]RUT30269.1 L,D-transpeptidase [Arsenicitalea aurantiaca]